MRASRPLAAAATALAVALAGCGDDADEVGGAQPVPAAGANAQTEVAGDAPYDITAAEWLKLKDIERFEAALAFIEDNPEACEGADGRAAADPVRNYADASIGTDYPLNAPVAELLAEGCAAALQSGTQDLAEE